MLPTARRTAWAVLSVVFLTACGSEITPRHTADSATSSAPAPAMEDPAEPDAELAGPAVDGTEGLLALGRTRHFWKTWVITYNGLKPHAPADGNTPPGWNQHGPTWTATITIRSLQRNPIRMRPTVTAQSGEGIPGTFGGFLGYSGETELGPADQLRLRALVGPL